MKRRFLYVRNIYIVRNKILPNRTFYSRCFNSTKPSLAFSQNSIVPLITPRREIYFIDTDQNQKLKNSDFILPKYKHCIWDWNGTLLDDTWLSLDIMNKLLQDDHLERLTLEKYKKVFDFPVRKFYAAIGLDTNPTVKFEELAGKYILEYEKRRHECRLIPWCTHVLEKLKQVYGMTHSILSAYKQEALEEILEHFGIKHYFNPILGNCDLLKSYVGKLPLGEKLIQMLPYNRDEIILIGDTVHDWEVAHSLGIDCLLVAYGHHDASKLSSCGAPVAYSMLDVLSFFCKHDPKLAVEMKREIVGTKIDEPSTEN